MNIIQAVIDAEERIRPFVKESAVIRSKYLSDFIDGVVYLKLELNQPTGSFKVRGATNKVMSLSEEELDRGVISASTGNHALAVGEAMKSTGREAIIYVANTIPKERLELLKSNGLKIEVFGNDPGEAEVKAREVAEEDGKIYISPYNDEVVMAGQGTCGLEISRQVPDADVVVIAVGGGGLIGGSAAYLKSFNPDIQITGVSPKNSPIMAESIKANKIIEMESLPTLADTCAGALDEDSITFDVCKKYVDEFDVLEEDEIADGIRLLNEHHNLVVEGSAALATAYLVKNKESFKAKTVVLVICGKNIGAELFKSVIRS